MHAWFATNLNRKCWFARVRIDEVFFANIFRSILFSRSDILSLALWFWCYWCLRFARRLCSHTQTIRTWSITFKNYFSLKLKYTICKQKSTMKCKVGQDWTSYHYTFSKTPAVHFFDEYQTKLNSTPSGFYYKENPINFFPMRLILFRFS